MCCRITAGLKWGNTSCIFAYKPSSDKIEDTRKKLNGSMTKERERNRENPNTLSYKKGNDSEQFALFIARSL
jgi:hypothetical protein